ncbi:RNA chaperone Hfq [Lihuaxuella thermophila]|uniref:RNA-binding protein Hfq n=1 Tax=Lihuaxuella thermophila TaxID=1173111 RepID=A0A1H8ATW5_9BACL|nr:host factor-I protein [Lihuaxuella thermophila]
MKNLQSIFLNQLRTRRTLVTIYLMNGFQFRGVIVGFDTFTLTVQITGGKQQLIYKHAISTIIPAEPVSMGQEPGEG